MSNDEDPLKRLPPTSMGLLQLCATPSSSTSHESHVSDSENSHQPSLLQSVYSWNPSSSDTHESAEPVDEKEPWLKQQRNRYESPKQVMANHRDAIRENIGLANSMETASQESYDSLVQSLDSLMQYTDSIDNAIDFHRIGGFDLLLPLMELKNDLVKSQTCQLIGDLVQNNSYCQKKALELNLLPTLFCFLDESCDDTVCLKALYAISCLCRNNPSALPHLIEVDGLSKLLRAIQKPSERLRTKAAFFLTNLCDELSEIRDILYDMGIVQLLACLLQHDFRPSHEYITSALLSLASHHAPSHEECLNPKLGLKDSIEGHLFAVPNEPQWLEVRKYLNDLSAYCVSDTMQHSDEAKSNEEIVEEELER